LCEKARGKPRQLARHSPHTPRADLNLPLYRTFPRFPGPGPRPPRTPRPGPAGAAPRAPRPAWGVPGAAHAGRGRRDVLCTYTARGIISGESLIKIKVCSEYAVWQSTILYKALFKASASARGGIRSPPHTPAARAPLHLGSSGPRPRLRRRLQPSRVATATSHEPVFSDPSRALGDAPGLTLQRGEAGLERAREGTEMAVLCRVPCLLKAC
jgi:hypothetical protein